MLVADQSKLVTRITAAFEDRFWSLLIDLRAPNAGRIQLCEITTPRPHRSEPRCLAVLCDGGNTTTLYEQIAIENHITPETLSTQLLGQMLSQLVDHQPRQETIAQLRDKLAIWISDLRGEVALLQ